MRKILSVVLAALMMLTFVGCGEAETLKFGMGVYATYGDVTSADGETNGAGEVIATVAAVLVDAEGKIVKVELDTADNTVEYTSAGAAVAGEFATKYELGDNYNMAAYGTDLNGDGKVLEWYAQADAFEATCVGKTVEEVKALIGEDFYHGGEELANAGCTMGVSDFIFAVEKAVANAKDSAATADDTLSVAVVTAQSTEDATADAEGSSELEINFAAAAKKDGKVTVMATDVLAATFTFDANGAATTDTTAAFATKLELGDNYNMAAYGADLNGDGKVLEWYAQADAFNAACVGLDANGIAALVVNGYGVDSLQTAGCTIGISDLVEVAVKAAK